LRSYEMHFLQITKTIEKTDWRETIHHKIFIER